MSRPGPPPVIYQAILPDGKPVEVLSIAVRDATAWLAISMAHNRPRPAGIVREHERFDGAIYVPASRVDRA